MAMWSLGDLGDLRVLDLLLAEEPIRPIGNDPYDKLARSWQCGRPAAHRRAGRSGATRHISVSMRRMRLGVIEDERTVEPLIAALAR